MPSLLPILRTPVATPAQRLHRRVSVARSYAHCRLFEGAAIHAICSSRNADRDSGCIQMLQRLADWVLAWAFNIKCRCASKVMRYRRLAIERKYRISARYNLASCRWNVR